MKCEVSHGVWGESWSVGRDMECGKRHGVWEETWSAEWRHEVQRIEPRTTVRGGKMVCGEET
jgi:hypothetical protein